MGYAIIDLGGAQRRVAPGDTIQVNRLQGEATATGNTLSLGRVLMLRTDSGVTLGSPLVEGASVKATVLGEAKGPKVIVFKMKRRKQYRRKNGHRAQFTRLRIDSIEPGE